MKKFLTGILILTCGFLRAQTEINPKIKSDKDKQFVQSEIDRNYGVYKKVARDIWGFAELGFAESKSSTELQELLKSNGFAVEAGMSGMPTAFTATYGAGGPVIGILAEFDALPGLSQDSASTKRPLIEGGSGHGCGHNLFGAASSAAAIALKEWLGKNHRAGTISRAASPRSRPTWCRRKRSRGL